jgi:HEAT repeat protein
MLGWLRFWDRRRRAADADAVPEPAAPPALPVSVLPRDLPPEHEALLRALADSSPEVRGRAADALTRDGARAVPALVEAMVHHEAHVRRAAILALGDIGPEAAPALTELVRAAVDCDEGVRRAASQVLARVDPSWAVAPATRRALPAVIDGLRSELPWVSRAAEALLLRVGRPAVPALLEVLADWEAEGHRRTALRLLSQLGPSAAEAAPALADVLGSSDPEFRLAAAEALARLGAGAAPALPALIRSLSDWSPPVRRSAAKALAAAGPGAGYAIPWLLGLLADWDDPAREAAAAALVAIGAAAVPLLAVVLEERDLGRTAERPRYREEVDRLWRRLEDEGCWSAPDTSWHDPVWAAREGLRERTEAVHLAAATALGRIGPAAAPAVPALSAALSDESYVVRLAVVRAVGEIGPPARDLLPQLSILAASGTDAMRKVAAEALARIGTG